jgi:hypothetical protein
MKRILYFTAGQQATAGELADIAALNALAEKPYEVRVMSALQSPNYGAGPITGDFLAGTIPAAYKDEQENPIYPVFDITSPPAPPTLPATQAIVSDEDVLELLGEDVTASVADNVLSLSIAGTLAIVSNGQVLDVDGGGTVTLTIEDGVITGVVYAAGE